MTASLEADIIALERAALNRWGKGDVDGYLELSTADVSYFDPMTPSRIDGHDALAEYYRPFRGLIKIDRDHIVRPRVQVRGDVAVLTFQFISEGSEGSKKWNCTEVYMREPEGWRIAHTHWSFAAA
jgi:ketosteroid isomerase-like protein